MRERREQQSVEDMTVSGADGQPVSGCHGERDREVMRALVEGRRARGLDAKAK